MALYELRKKADYEVLALITTITSDYKRVSMHGTREELLDRQAASIGLPLDKVYMTAKADNAEYEQAMEAMLLKYQAKGVTHVALGDIFLEDLRKYREEKLALVGMQGLFPVWKRDTKEMAQTFIDLGFRTIIACVDTQVLDGSFAGREYDASFLADLPEGVDPCGENGEFHSFCYDGPIFSEPVRFTTGEKVLKLERFMFCDLIPA